ncbi:bifunctional diguanylate cyclase/phosphodiesterase [Pseudalkalibacillus salsuginis]|uniref:bifunctional diguanylate cyclase/phosphodiesterase n=1 Tax=Pseudalkalibacillus salsuginis TaxID=2910972 RepID=UPI001F44670A|nr:EAL domain-containing protein [Pseudalkalibacillus salsuginis]MCF6408894.1 EAL domain-containing protein [Pseudalkalibacillus salsuginis]
MFNRMKEEHLRAIFNGFLEMVFLMAVEDGPKFRYVTANDSAIKYSGVDEGSFGKLMDEVLPKEVYEKLKEPYDVAYRTKEPLYYELATEINSTMMVGETILTPILDKTGECIYILAAVRDVTQKKKIKAELKSSKERYKYLYENTPAMYFTLNQAGMVVSFNVTGASKLGYCNHQLVGQPFSNFIDSRDKVNFQAHIQDLLQGKQTATGIEVRLLHKEGSSFWVDQRMNVMSPRPGEAEIVCVSYEIQEQKEAEAQLLGQKRIFELIATDIMLEEILEVTAKTVENHIDDVLCTIHLYSREKEVLHLVSAPTIDERYKMQLSELMLGENASGCGRAASRKKPVIVDDIDKDPLGLQLNHLSEHRIRAYWVMPILSSKNILLGIMTFYSLNNRIPSERDERLIKMYSDLAVLAIEQKNTKQALKESEARLRLMTENMSDLIVMLDRKGEVIYISPSYKNIFGREPLLGNSFLTYIHEEDRKLVMQKFETLFKTKKRQDVECRYFHGDGESIVLEARAMPVLTENKEVKQVVVVARDITERKKTDETIKHMAYHDALTNLPNRRKFQQDLGKFIEKSNGNDIAGVLFLDMDRFKIINDSLGHAFGDRVLLLVGEKLKSLIDRDGSVYRMSGDEFTILMPKVNRISDLCLLAKRISKLFEEPIILEGHEFRISLSIGVSIYPDDGEDVETLLVHSDMAMYRAKEQGRNSYEFYNPSMNENNYERLVLENDLHKAVENDELLLHYQPRIDVKTAEIIGVEALVRWNHPQWGLISPAEFIPLAEETGLIVQIDNWVLEAACKQNKRWQEKGFRPIRMAVNFSAKQFLQRDLTVSIRNVLTKYGLDGRFLEIEITESTLMKYEESIIKSLEELERMGVRIAIDDFGTGYSSLNYLKKFHVHSLKIDQSFIMGIEKNSDEAAIARAVITLGHSMKMFVIAEGVETEEQFAFLRSQNCNEVQGFHFYRPMASNLIEELLQEKQGTL